MEDPFLEIVLIIICIFLSALFAGTETAIISLSEAQIHKILDEKKRNIRLLKAWRENPNKVLSVILIGNTFANICASALATALAINLFNTIGIHSREGLVLAVAVGVTTFIVLIFGEIVPKTFAKHNTKKMLLFFPLMYIFYVLLKWLDTFFAWITRIIIPALGGKIKKDGPLVTEAEIESMIRLGSVVGSLSEDKQKLLTSIMEFSETTVKEIMVPRTDVIGMKADILLEEILRECEESKFSRYPVYNESVDEILGVFYAKDLIHQLKLTTENRNNKFNLQNFLHPVFYVPETKKIKELLREFQKRHLHLAIVVDEFGGTSGIVSLEDVIEEIVGEIHDEYDEQEFTYKKISDLQYLVQAKMPLKELEDILNLPFPDDEDYETLGGFILKKMGKVPEKGEEMEYKDHNFTIKDRDETKIILVEVEKKIQPPTETKTSIES